MGERVRKATGGWGTVRAVRSAWDAGGRYNLTVEEAHTYAVGDGDWVAHNSCPLGGRYKDIPANGGEVHHMPAKSISPLSKGNGPAIRMDTVDHHQTASWGRGKAAQAYREIQRQLIAAGRFDDAIQMDIDDVRSKFGTKYDAAILEMIDSLK